MSISMLLQPGDGHQIDLLPINPIYYPELYICKKCGILISKGYYNTNHYDNKFKDIKLASTNCEQIQNELIIKNIIE